MPPPRAILQCPAHPTKSHHKLRGGDVLLVFVVCMVVWQVITCVQPTSPSLMRLSMMLIPYSVLMRSSRYHAMYSSSIVGEPVDRDAREVALVEELLLEMAEEPLRGRVAGAAALRAHRAGQPVALADAYPFRPPVVAAAVRVDDGRVADLTPVRGVAPRAPGHGHEPVPGHQAHDPFGGHDDARAPQFQVDVPVPVTAPAVLEHAAPDGTFTG